MFGLGVETGEQEHHASIMGAATSNWALGKGGIQTVVVVDPADD